MYPRGISAEYMQDRDAIVNRVLPVCDKQRLIRSQQQQQSSLLKKGSNYKLPDESAVFNHNGKIQ